MGEDIHPMQAIEQSAPCPSGTPQYHWLHDLTKEKATNSRALLIDLDNFKKTYTITVVGLTSAQGISATTTNLAHCTLAADRKTWNTRHGAPATPPKNDVQHVRFRLGESARSVSGSLKDDEGVRNTGTILRHWWPDRRPGQMLTFIGHTDNVGFAPSASNPRGNERTSAGCNMRLSLARAYHVAEAVLSASDHRDIRGEKKVHLVACGAAIATPTSSAAGNEADRRVDIMVVGGRGYAPPSLPTAR